MIVRTCVFALALLGAAQPSPAQTYPTKPIRFVVPFAPGGGTDLIGSVFAQYLQETLGQPVVVGNRRDFIEAARARPGKYAYASAGLGSGTHLAAELIKMLVKIDVVHVPYKGTGPALNDLIGGQIQLMVSTFASALPHVRSGRLRALGVTTLKRSPAAPDVPTLHESGVTGFDYSTWYALFVPAGTPRPVVDRLNATTVQVLGREDVKQRLDAQGVDAATSTPAELAAYLKSETVKWGKVVRATGARGE